jgi:hypothetical protein
VENVKPDYKESEASPDFSSDEEDRAPLSESEVEEIYHAVCVVGSTLTRNRFSKESELDVRSVKRGFLNFIYALRVENSSSVENYARQSKRSDSAPLMMRIVRPFFFFL